MRQIFLDTETTGLELSNGHRLIEIGAVELLNRQASNNKFHSYLNPSRDVDSAAYEVHGISSEFLKDKPVFSDIAQNLIAFIASTEVIIHNASFDVGFINHELQLAGLAPLEHHASKITDSLMLARHMRPGQSNSLEALCRHFNINLEQRKHHGALIDAQLLREVYLALTRGQNNLAIGSETEAFVPPVSATGGLPPIHVLAATAEELSRHQSYLDELKNSLWHQL